MSATHSPNLTLDFAFAYGKPEVEGALRAENSDFQVKEILPENFSGDGEHAYVFIEKNGENTQWIARQLAEFCHVERNAVGYAGLKDRNAVTQQWFSVQLPGQPDPNWQQFAQPNWRVLKNARHNRKLRQGDHLANAFNIVVRGEFSEHSRSTVEHRLTQIKSEGVPNYFGRQRFGREAENLNQAERWFTSGQKIKNRQQKSFVLSAARSFLFNWVLSQRVQDGNWKVTIPGDVIDEQMPTGPLWGRGRLSSTDQTLANEQHVLNYLPRWCDALEHQGLQQERRKLVLLPSNLNWQWGTESLVLQFELAPGQFATSVLRELILSPEC